MLQPFETEFIKAFASNPTENANYLMSPNVNAGVDWLPSPLGKKFLASVGHIVVSGLAVNPINIISYSDLNLGRFTQEEIKYFIEVWRSASKDPCDIREIAQSIRNDVIIHGADSAIGEYRASIQKTPSRAIDHIDSLVGKLSVLSNDGVDYDPSPVNALSEPVMERKGTWGNVVFDEMFSIKGKDTGTGGVPKYGFVIGSMPTKHGKSTLGISMMAHLIAYAGLRGVIMSNELPRAMYSQPIKRALTSMYAGEISDKEVDDILEDRLKIYAPSTDPNKRGVHVKTFEQMNRIIKFTKPSFAIMDSINSVSAPSWASRMDELTQHQKKAESFRDLCLDEQIIMYCPGNMSEAIQSKLRSRKEADSVSSVVLYGSKEYEGCCDFAFVGWRDIDSPEVVYIKRTANRHGTSFGEKWAMKYTDAGYYTPYF